MPKDNHSLTLSIKRLPHGEGLPLPAYASEGAAGLDLPAAIPEGESMRLAPWGRGAVPTGFALELPKGYEAQVRPRSGLALKHGLTVINTPGTIDADYRGEVMVLLVNLGSEPFEVTRGMRIAQLVVAPVTRAHLIETDALQHSERGAGGFGSTGSH